MKVKGATVSTTFWYALLKKVEEPLNDNDAESIATNLDHAKNGTLLQTAIAMVSNLSNTKSDNFAILFDNGSQRSFISAE